MTDETVETFKNLHRCSPPRSLYNSAGTISTGWACPQCQQVWQVWHDAWVRMDNTGMAIK